MSMHVEASPLAGKLVHIAIGRMQGQQVLVEDWWDRIAGKSWMDCDGNPACLMYAISSAGDPVDDEVVYGKIGSFGHLIHVTHLGEVA